MPKIEICDRKKCYGCGACAQKCPVKAISMQPDKEGFLYPIISNKCINCSECITVCPSRSDKKTPKTVSDVYAMQLKDKQLLLKSTSGGAFILFATEIIRRGGVVYGASYDSNMIVKHTCAETMEKVFPMQGSKYVQSDLNNVYSDIQQRLQREQYVLFTGTPCQIEGLLSFLGEDANKKTLYMLDLICSGVPSPLLFRKRIEYLEKNKNEKVIQYDFRSKDKYGCSNTTNIVIKNNNLVRTVIIPDRTTEHYYVAFGMHLCLRPSCYECRYSTIERKSDFTCGDYVGTNKQIQVLGEREGISQLIIHSEKGRALFEILKPQVKYMPISIDDAKEGNKMLYSSIPPEVRQPEMFDFLLKYGYKKTAQKFFPVKKYTMIKKLIPQPLKLWLSKLWLSKFFK